MKILILTSSSSPYVPLLLEPFLREYASSVCGVMTVQNSGSPESGSVAKIRRVVQQAGVRYTALKVILFGAIRVHQLIGTYPGLDVLLRRFSLKRLSVPSIRSAETLALVRDCAPDVILSVLFEKIIPSELFSIASRAALNFHPAPLPRYGGIAPTFWVLSNGEHETAVTVHVLSEGIDTGDIVAQSPVAILAGDTVHSLYLRCCTVGGKLILNTVRNLEAGEVPRMPQNESAQSYFQAPTIDGYARLLGNGFGLYLVTDLFLPLASSKNFGESRQ